MKQAVILAAGEGSRLRPFTANSPEAMLVKRVDNPTRYGVVGIDNGVVKDIVEQPKEAKSNIISTRIYAFSKEAFSFIESE